MFHSNNPFTNKNDALVEAVAHAMSGAPTSKDMDPNKADGTVSNDADDGILAKQYKMRKNRVIDTEPSINEGRYGGIKANTRATYKGGTAGVGVQSGVGHEHPTKPGFFSVQPMKLMNYAESMNIKPTHGETESEWRDKEGHLIGTTANGRTAYYAAKEHYNKMYPGAIKEQADTVLEYVGTPYERDSNYVRHTPGRVMSRMERAGATQKLGPSGDVRWHDKKTGKLIGFVDSGAIGKPARYYIHKDHLGESVVNESTLSTRDMRQMSSAHEASAQARHLAMHGSTDQPDENQKTAELHRLAAFHFNKAADAADMGHIEISQLHLQRALQFSNDADEREDTLHLGEQAVAEKTLTPAELKKREEVAAAIERENPSIDKSKKMAIATSVAIKTA